MVVVERDDRVVLARQRGEQLGHVVAQLVAAGVVGEGEGSLAEHALGVGPGGDGEAA
jgi:hypothetical protein